MDLILTIATVLGGITAIWFLFEKYKSNKSIVSDALKIPEKANTKTIELKLLRKVNIFLDNGDISSAKTVLLEGQIFEDIHTNRMLEIIIIEQKYGQIESALQHISIAEKEIKREPITSSYVQLELLKFKLHSQSGNIEYIKCHAKRIINLLDIVNERQKIPSILNRLGVYYSINKEIDNAKKCYEESLFISIKYNLRHTEITTKMFIVISQSLCGIDLGVSNPLEEIIKIQNDYISAGLSDDDLDLWQTHLLKSVVQTLFCEAAILYINGHRISASLRLCAANLLAVAAKANPRAEGYSDLLNLTSHKKLKNLLIFAMSTEDDKRERFLSSIGTSPLFLVQLQSIVKPNYTFLNKKVWNTFRNHIEEQDKNDKK